MKPFVLNSRDLRPLCPGDLRAGDGRGKGLKDADCTNRVSPKLIPGRYF